jgi:RNA polymerase sigma-70 factor (ECF subfamily)
LDCLRRNKGRQPSVEDHYTADVCQQEENELRIDLERAIRVLPDNYRLVLILHDIEGFTHQEIAEKLGIPDGTTKSQLFRARKMIREWLWERNGANR